MLLINGNELVIRKAKKEDVEKIIEYLNIVGGESDYLTFGANEITMDIEQKTQFEEDVDNSSTAAFFIGLIGCRVICEGTISSQSKKRISHQGNIGLSVLKEFWGLGVGTSLMNTMITFAKQIKKLEVLHLGVRADNTRAINLYKKFGFKEIGFYPKFYKINNEYFGEKLMNLYL